MKTSLRYQPMPSEHNMLLLAIATIAATFIGKTTADPWEDDRKRGNGFFMEIIKRTVGQQYHNESIP